MGEVLPLMARGHVEKRGKRGWTTLVIEHDPDLATGERRRTKTALKLAAGQAYMTKAQAQAVLSARLTDLSRGTYISTCPLTLGEFLERWLEARCRRRLARATVENYEICVRHLVPELGALPVDRLESMRLQDTYSRWLTAGKDPRTVEQIHQVLHIALSYGVRMQLLSRNVSEFVEPPHPKKREMVALDPEQLDKLLEAAHKTPLFALITVAAYTGMRRGELLGLAWENVDLENATVRVEGLLQRVNRETIVKGPKTAAGRRTIPIAPEAVAVLRELRQHNPYHLVFCKADGLPYDPSYVTHRFSEIARKAGFRMRLHDLRHTYATLALASKVDLRVVQELMGHEDMSTTANIYTHVLKGLKRDAAEAIGRTINGGVRHHPGTKSESDGDPQEKD